MASPRTLLIGIGAQKSGTSWLASYLLAHPQVFMSPIKELHFWNTRSGKSGGAEKRFRQSLARLEARGADVRPEVAEKRSNLAERLAMNNNIEAYLEFFRKRAGDQDVWCEITPAYSLLDRHDFARIATLAEDVRFVFLMRNPADRFWSHLRFSRRARPDLDVNAAFRPCLEKDAYVLRTNYRRVIEELGAAIDLARVHLGFFEWLFTQSEVDRLCDFLSIARIPADFQPVGRTPGGEVMSDEMRALAVRHFAPVYRFVEARFGGDIPTSWQADMALYLG
jgi:hypothetical protein